MRLEDELTNRLTQKGFRKVETNANGIRLLYLPLNDGVYAISINSIYNGDELTAESYRHIISNMKDFFKDRSYPAVNLLGVILTGYPEKVKSFCALEDTHWIIDLSGKRLIIYENQTSDFIGLKDEIERLLEEENAMHYEGQGNTEPDNVWQNSRGYADPNYAGRSYAGRATVPVKKVGWITLMNTIIIVVNVLVYLLSHYTGFFGKPARAVENGSLSWYHIKEYGEYYRLLTSMFLHYNFGHLFNNMLVLFFVGDNLERAAGRLKYLLIYFGSGILAGIASISYNMWKGNTEVYSVGASGAIFGIVGAMGYILIRNNGRLEDFRTSQLILFAAFSLYGGIISANIDNAAHIGGFLAGVVLAVLLYRKPGMKASHES